MMKDLPDSLAQADLDIMDAELNSTGDEVVAGLSVPAGAAGQRQNGEGKRTIRPGCRPASPRLSSSTNKQGADILTCLRGKNVQGNKESQVATIQE